jgi:hypothetical protein
VRHGASLCAKHEVAQPGVPALLAGLQVGLVHTATPCPAICPCLPCHHVNLADDLAITHLKGRLDHDATAVRVLARLPERHPLLADNFPLDAVRRPLAEDRPQVLGDLRLPAQLEGGVCMAEALTMLSWASWA